MKTIVWLACAVMITSAAAAGMGSRSPQQKPDEQRPAVTFKTGVDLVAVDVSVVDRRGRPVSDLASDDFVLTVDGKPRKLVSAQFISQTRTVESPRRAETYSSNAAAAGGRLIMLVVDQSNIRRGSGKTVAEAIGRFIGRLTPADRIGLAVIPGEGQNVDFTANHALVRSLVSRIVGRAERLVGQFHVGVSEAFDLIQRNDAFVLNRMVERECISLARALPDEDPAGPLKECRRQLVAEARAVLDQTRARTDESLTALRGVLARLASTNEPKTIIYVSEGLVLGDRRAQLSWVGPLAAAARASLYVLRLEPTLFDTFEQRVSGTIADDVQLEIEGLEQLAGMARGAIFPVASSPDRVLDRLALELSGYYLLSFEPEGSDRDGKAHRIDVKVRREGVEVRARREFSVDSARASMTDEDLLAETLRSPLLATELPVKVTTYTFRDVASGKLKVMIAADIDRHPSPPGDLALAYALVDNNGKLAASDLQKGLAPPTPDATSQVFSGAVLVDPGIYTLKLAVLDLEGKRGSVEHTFRAQLQSAGQLRLGELLVAEVRRGATREVRPLVDTEIAADSLYAYLEMYSDAAAQLEAASVTLEIASDPNGLALESGVFQLQEVEGGRRRVGEGDVPLALLPPGSYVARAAVSVGGRSVARITRPFRIARALPEPTATGEPRTAGAAVGASSLALATAVGAFRRDSVLAPHVMEFFLDRLFTAETAASAASLRGVTGAARAGQFDAVAAQLDGLDPKVAAELAPTFLRGLVLLARGELEAAAGQFREAIRLDSGFFPAAFYLGACYAAGGRDREAVGAWQTALVTEDDAPFVFTLVGDALLRLGDAGRATDILREAATLWPDNDEVRVRLGMAFAMGGFAPEALATLDPYLERHPDDHERLFFAMRLLYERSAAGRAVGTLDEDRARLARYARAYAATGGPQQALVEEWRKFMEKK